MNPNKHLALFNENCYESLKEVPNESIDLILTDPPYNIPKSKKINLPNRKDLNINIAKWDELELDIPKLAQNFKRIIKPTGNIFIFCNYSQFGIWHKLLDSFMKTNFMVWHKIDPMPSIRKTSFVKSCELIICAWNNGHTWNFGKQMEMQNIIESSTCKGNERLAHPTQKPVVILEKIIKMASNVGDRVFDPFMGVGSTGEASIKLDRKFLGIEIDAVYYALALNRLKKAKQRQRYLKAL